MMKMMTATTIDIDTVYGLYEGCSKFFHVEKDIFAILRQ